MTWQVNVPNITSPPPVICLLPAIEQPPAERTAQQVSELKSAPAPAVDVVCYAKALYDYASSNPEEELDLLEGDVIAVEYKVCACVWHDRRHGHFSLHTEQPWSHRFYPLHPFFRLTTAGGSALTTARSATVSSPAHTSRRLHRPTKSPYSGALVRWLFLPASASAPASTPTISHSGTDYPPRSPLFRSQQAVRRFSSLHQDARRLSSCWALCHPLSQFFFLARCLLLSPCVFAINSVLAQCVCKRREIYMDDTSFDQCAKKKKRENG